MKWDRIAALLAALVIAAGYFVPVPAKAEGLVPVSKIADAAGVPSVANWTGFYVGVHGGYGVAVGELTHDGDSLIRGLSADGFIGGVHAGFDYQFSGTPWVVGVRGAYTWSNMEFTAGGGDLTIGVDDGWSVDGRVGYAMGSALPYVFAGYTQVNTSNNVGAPSPTLEGWRGGAGVEFRIPGAQFVTLGLDYTYTRYDNVDIYCLTVEPEDHRVLARLNFRFGK